MSDESTRTPATALEQWRTAERALASATRGKEAAVAAAETAQSAATAALATATSAKAALEAATLAEASASATASAAERLVKITAGEVTSTAEDELAAIKEELASHDRYRDAEAEARKRIKGD